MVRNQADKNPSFNCDLGRKNKSTIEHLHHITCNHICGVCSSSDYSLYRPKTEAATYLSAPLPCLVLRIESKCNSLLTPLRGMLGWKLLLLGAQMVSHPAGRPQAQQPSKRKHQGLSDDFETMFCTASCLLASRHPLRVQLCYTMAVFNFSQTV